MKKLFLSLPAALLLCAAQALAVPANPEPGRLLQPDGTVVTGKATGNLSAVSAAILNAIKVIAAVDGNFNPIPPETLKQVEILRTDVLGNDTKLRADEMLIALAISAKTSTESERAFSKLKKLRGCDLHGSVVLYPQDNSVLRKLGINVTCEPVHQDRILYRN